MKKKDITLTPIELIKEIGNFDLDPCGFNGHKTADTIYSLPEDGLKKDWFGKVWLNPPYSETIKWIKKMAKHNDGVACVLASTETNWFQEYVLKKANAIFFLKSRPKFLNDRFEKVNLMRGVILVSYGECINYLKKCELDGVYVELMGENFFPSEDIIIAKPQLKNPSIDNSAVEVEGLITEVRSTPVISKEDFLTLDEPPSESLRVPKGRV